MKINKETVTQAMNLDSIGSFDYAIPLPWIFDMEKEVSKKTSYLSEKDVQRILRQIVWFYGKDANNSFGCPCPLSESAAELLHLIGYSLPEVLKTVQLQSVRELADEVWNTEGE